MSLNVNILLKFLDERIKMFNPEDRANFTYILESNSKKTKFLEINQCASKTNYVELVFTKSLSNALESVKTELANKILLPKARRKNILNIFNSESTTKFIEVNNEQKKYSLSLQSKSLEGALKFSKLIYITPFIYLKNTTEKNLYIYHFQKKQKFPIFYQILEARSTIKFYYLSQCFQFIKFSFHGPEAVEDQNLFSGLINFNQQNNEFYIELTNNER